MVELCHELSSAIQKLFRSWATGYYFNNICIDGTEGSLFGHQTQFDLGVNFNTSTRLKYFAKLNTSYTSYPAIQ